MHFSLDAYYISRRIIKLPVYEYVYPCIYLITLSSPFSTPLLLYPSQYGTMSMILCLPVCDWLVLRAEPMFLPAIIRCFSFCILIFIYSSWVCCEGWCLRTDRVCSSISPSHAQQTVLILTMNIRKPTYAFYEMPEVLRTQFDSWSLI